MAHLWDYLTDITKNSDIAQASVVNGIAIATVAAVPLRHNIAVAVDASYSTSSVSGLLSLRFGPTVKKSKRIHGQGSIDFWPLGLQNDNVNQEMTAELEDGGGGVTGTVLFTYYRTGFDAEGINVITLVLTDSLISWWPLDEASGERDDVHDVNDLTDNATVTQAAAAKVGNAAQFTAANSEYLSLADNSLISIDGGSFSMACWVYLDTKVSNRTFISKWAAGAPREFSLLWDLATDRFRFEMNTTPNAVNADTLGIPAVTTWYYIIAWFDSVAGTMNIQVNNGTVNTTTGVSAASASTNPFYLGARNTGAPADFHNGRMDEVALAKRVWTATERTFLYNSGTGRSYNEIP